MINKSLLFKFSLLTICLFILFLSSCDEQSLKQQFIDPPREYRMNQNIHEIPLLEEKQDSLIQAYLEMGYGGFAVNVPYSEYLTDKGMTAFKAFCDKAKASDMELWLYDENGYPSGNAGDLVINENPSWEAMGLFFDDTLVGSGSVYFRLPPGEPLEVSAYPVAGDKTDFTKSIDLRPNIREEYLSWIAPLGKWNIIAVTKHHLYEGFQVSKKPGGSSSPHYPSLMIPEVTETFLRVNHEVYADYFGEDLGKYFVSTFTDEPSLMAVPFEWYSWSVIPWQQVLSDEIEKRYAYRPEEKLAELFADAGPTGQKLRYQYFHTVGDLMANNFFKKIKEWCEDHGFRSGGHLLLEETMMAQVPLYGDIMKCFREMHAPGIDILSCYPKFMPVHSPKMAYSAKELSGNDLVMSEPCPIMERFTLGDEPPASKVRGHLNMLLAGGVTDFNNYLKLSRSDTRAKVEMNEYVGRINMMLRGGVTDADIGILYPIESLWTKFTPSPMKVVDGFFTDPDVSGWDTLAGGDPAAIRIEQSFRNVSRFMFANRWEYSYLDTRALVESEIENGELVHGDLNWKVIILPAVNTLPEKAWKKLLEFIASGGKVIALEDLPHNTESSFPDEELQSRTEKLFRESAQAVLLHNWKAKKLDAVLNENLHKAFQTEKHNPYLRLAMKIIDNYNVLFIFNDSEDRIKENIHLNYSGEIEEWDPSSGKMKIVSEKFQMNLLPYHGKIYRIKTINTVR